MKIYSKYKDYYDYLAGIYGEDALLVLDRRSGDAKIVLPFDTVATLFIGKKVIQGLYKNGQFFWGDELKKMAEDSAFATRRKISPWRQQNSKGMPLVFNLEQHGRSIWQYVYHTHLEEPGEDLKKELARDFEKHHYAIDYAICMHAAGIGLFPYPKLENIAVGKMIPAEIIWRELSDFLSAKNQEPEKDIPLGNDTQRMLSHGFDLKTSFRKEKQ
ncbi:MAG: hypothetical protein QM664_03185 [Flavihumibacter sp.]